MHRILADRPRIGFARRRAVTIRPLVTEMAAGTPTTRADPIHGSAVYPLAQPGQRSQAGSRSAAVTWSSSRASSATPAYIYATDDIRARARAYVEAFGSRLT